MDKRLERFTARTKGRSDGQLGYIEVGPYVRHYGDCDIYSLTPVCTCGLLMELKWIHPYEERERLFPAYREDLRKQRWMNTRTIENAILKYKKENPIPSDEEVALAMEQFEKEWNEPPKLYVEPKKRYFHFLD